MKNNKSSLLLNRRMLNNSLVNALTCLTFSLVVPQANAVEVVKKAILTTAVDYDSNPGLSQNNEHSVIKFSVSPELLVDVNDELNRWYMDALLLVQRHSNETVLVNREDPRLTVGWDHTYESGIIGIKAFYKESSSRDAQLRSTGVFTQLDNTETDQELSGKWQHNINPLWSLVADAAYNDVGFSRAGNLNGYNMSAVGIRLNNLTTERLDIFGQVTYSHINPSGLISTTDLTHLVMGADYKVNEAFTMGAFVGANNLSGVQSRTNWTGNIKAEFKTEAMAYSAVLVRGEFLPSALGGFQEDDSATLGWIYNINEREKLGADLSITKYKKDSSISLTGQDYKQYGAYYERNLSNKWRTRVSAIRRELDTSISNSNANVLGVSLIFDTLSF